MAYTTINKPSGYFNTLTYTGDGTDNRSITGLGFQPDFCWFKDRTGANSHNLFDSVRGVNKPLISNSTSAELTGFNLFNSFDSDGFTISGATADNTNFNGNNFVSWSWLADGTGVSNTDGSIASTVSANTTSGFSIVTYTGTAVSGATVGHGLGVAPSVVILKNRTGYDWQSYWSALGNTRSMVLNSNSTGNTGTGFWNNTNPSSSVVTLGNDGSHSGNCVMYCFAEKKGFSKFGSYTGNGNNDGTFVYLGFKPAFVMVKNTVNNARNWTIIDNKRNTFNPETQWLYPNTSDIELTASSYPVDFVSNGFKIRTGVASYFNTSGENYIYMAFAESPFVTSTGIPTCAK